jgi:hypothetical protein
VTGCVNGKRPPAGSEHGVQSKGPRLVGLREAVEERDGWLGAGTMRYGVQHAMIVA